MIFICASIVCSYGCCMFLSNPKYKMREIDEVQSQSPSRSFKLFFYNCYLLFNCSFMFVESNHPENNNCLMSNEN